MEPGEKESGHDKRGDYAARKVVRVIKQRADRGRAKREIKTSIKTAKNEKQEVEQG